MPDHPEVTMWAAVLGVVCLSLLLVLLHKPLQCLKEKWYSCLVIAKRILSDEKCGDRFWRAGQQTMMPTSSPNISHVSPPGSCFSSGFQAERSGQKAGITHKHVQ